MSLEKYDGKKVKITATNGRTFSGRVTDYDDGYYAGDGRESIAIKSDVILTNAEGYKYSYVLFYPEDIKSIEVIE